MSFIYADSETMEIRKSTLEDLSRLMEIFNAARDYMRKSGNATQWNNGYPSEEIIRSDIQKGISYVITSDNRIVGTFVFVIGADPAYSIIEGRWLNDNPYGTIHRIASDGTARGIADKCLSYCKNIMDNIRIDTHKDNSAMLKWITRSKFKYCGIIHISDGTPRYAFQLKTEEK